MNFFVQVDFPLEVMTGETLETFDFPYPFALMSEPLVSLSQNLKSVWRALGNARQEARTDVMMMRTSMVAFFRKEVQ